MATKPDQLDMFGVEPERAMLDQLLEESSLYRDGKQVGELLNFVARLRDFAPFNAMLLNVQKPGLSYAASRADWRSRFKREVKFGARPLLIMWPFGPVALVYDVMDTEGEELPESIWSFPADGQITDQDMAEFERRLQAKGIHWHWVDHGDRNAGRIRAKPIKQTDGSVAYRYDMQVNRNHSSSSQFATLAHELAHLCLGHLGGNKTLKIPDRRGKTHTEVEIEAESVAYIICKRQGVNPYSERYLSNYIDGETDTNSLELYSIMKAAGRVERLLGLNEEILRG